MVFSAPARVDLAGGTLDIPPLCYFIKDTLTLNLAVSLRAAVSLQPGSGRVRAAGFPEAGIDDLPLFAFAFDYFDLGRAWDVVVENAVPQASGLGGSSTLLTALMNALHARAGGAPCREDLLRMVTVLENRLLGKPAGVQDAVAALYGGLSEIRFESGTPVRTELPTPSYLQGRISLVYCRVQHHSGMNNWALLKAACEGDQQVLGVFHALNDNAHAMRDALAGGNRADFTACLRREAALRDELWPGLKTDAMAAFADELPPEFVAKVCGAGGGGCMLVFGEHETAEIPAGLTEKHGLELIEVHADARGCEAQ